MAALAKVLEEVLALPVETRNRVVEFLHETKALPPDEQAQRVRDFVETLEAEHDVVDDAHDETTPEWRAAWAAEVRRREQAVDDGRARLIPHDEVMAKIRALLRR